MAEFQNFRSAFNGFNREDVVRYIEYLNNRHTCEKNQLKTQLQTVQSQLDSLKNTPNASEELAVRLENANSRIAELEDALQALQSEKTQSAQSGTTQELEAYRRAERAERAAHERVAQLYAQANGALAEATEKVDSAAAQIGSMADLVTDHLNALQKAVASGKDTLQTAASALYALRPAEQED